MKSKRTIPLVIAAVLWAGPTAHAAGYTLGQCIALAQEHSEAVRMQAERAGEAASRVTQGSGGMKPEAHYKYTRLERDTNNDAYASDVVDSKFTVTQPLYAGGRKKGAADAARADLASAEYTAKDVARALAGEVIQAFYALVQSDADIANIRATEALLRDRLTELSERVRLGKARESETLMIESQLASLRAQESKAQGDRGREVETLALLTGADPETLAVADTAQSPAPAEPLEKYIEAARNRVDVAAARQDAAAQAIRVKLARGGLLPTLNLDGALYTARSGSYANSDWEAQLSLDVPLYQGGILRAKVAEEEARQREYGQRAAQLEHQAVAEARTRYRAFVSSTEQAAAFGDAYAKAEKSYQMQLRDYRYGLVNNLDVLSSMTSMLDVKNSYDRAQAQARADRALLDVAVGR